MNSITVNCPAKINLTLEIVNKREDGFHNIKSIMQTISLYDTLIIKVGEGDGEILLSGNSSEIPYNEKNLVYRAAELFYRETGINNVRTEIYIDKNIPISAGLAGGSSDAAGTIFGLNELLGHPLKTIHKLCETLGSDLNVCLEGGSILATSRGEVIKKLKPVKSKLTLIKPKNLGISAREAYTKYSNKTNKPQKNMTEKMLNAFDNNQDFSEYLYNDLEYAVFDDYKELKKIKEYIPNAVMSGSGSTYFVLGDEVNTDIPGDDYQIIKGLEFIETGVTIAQCNNFVTN